MTEHLYVHPHRELMLDEDTQLRRGVTYYVPNINGSGGTLIVPPLEEREWATSERREFAERMKRERLEKKTESK